MSVSVSQRPPHFREKAAATCQQNCHEALALRLSPFHFLLTTVCSDPASWMYLLDRCLALCWPVFLFCFSFHVLSGEAPGNWPLLKLCRVRVWPVLPHFSLQVQVENGLLSKLVCSTHLEITTPFFLPHAPSLALFCYHFSPNWCQTPRAGGSLLVKSKPIDVAIHSPPSVKAITLLFARFALYGGAIPRGDGSLTQEYAWVEKN